jgi:hypothetical protein
MQRCSANGIEAFQMIAKLMAAYREGWCGFQARDF